MVSELQSALMPRQTRVTKLTTGRKKPGNGFASCWLLAPRQLPRDMHVGQTRSLRLHFMGGLDHGENLNDPLLNVEGLI